jgi:hypothetical protein
MHVTIDGVLIEFFRIVSRVGTAFRLYRHRLNEKLVEIIRKLKFKKLAAARINGYSAFFYPRKHVVYLCRSEH